MATLDPEASASRRDELIHEFASISSFDVAAEWAKRIIPIKNTLTSEHARKVETVLEAKTMQYGNSLEEAFVIAPARSGGGIDQGQKGEFLITPDRSSLMFGHPPRRRNKEHLKFVAAHACLLCGRRPSDAHHLKFAQPQAMGRKVSDEFTVPLCRTHHRQLHRSGNEAAWWQAINHDVNPLDIAKRLWEQSRQGVLYDPAIPRHS